MRYREFKLTEQQLEELKMSPSSLGAFAKSPVAQGIQAGFEAEIIFPGMGGVGDDDDGDMEPDYDYDERCNSIDDIIRFFEYDDYGFGMSQRESSRLYDQLTDAYQEFADEQIHSEFRDEALGLIREYIEENDFDWDEKVREHLESQGLDDAQIEDITDRARRATSSKDTPPEYRDATDAANEELDELAQSSLDDQDSTYDRVLDQFRDDFSYPEEREFLRDADLDFMSDVASEYDISWPYMRVEGGDENDFNEDNAQQLADDLSRTLGYDVEVSDRYHGQSKNATSWYFEPDSSLEAESGDMPVEIVSPPMPLDQCLDALDNFFSWAKGFKAYTNNSTGFHMGVSLPEVGGKVDFVKLALFLGDEYVLQTFGRQAIGYCESAIKKIKNRMKGQDDRISDAMALMRKGLIDIAHNSIASDEGFGKYTSINPKGNYIEFRSAGGKDYSKDIPKLRNMLLRYSQAMVVAADPQAERNEYYKKLYKLIAPATGDASLDLFARFASGAISKEDLKQQWATATLEKEKPSGEPTKWEVFDQRTGSTLATVDAATRGEAMDIGFEMGFTPNSYTVDARPAPAPEPKPSRRLDLAKRIKGPTPPNYYIRNIDTEEVVYLYSAHDNEDAVKYLNKYSSTHPGKFQYGQTRFLQPDELAQAKKNTQADTATQQPAQQQSEPQHLQQVRSSNGVPMWDIYQRSNGLSLHQFADHTQTSAWSTAQEWARRNSFDPSDLSVRPVMPQD